jgi:phosphatidylglycerophosphate synthase
MKSVPDLLCYARLLLVPVVLALALSDLPFYAVIALLAAGITDVLDGIIARRWNIATAYGSRLDSIADTLMEISALGALLLLRPEIITGHALVLGAWIVIEASSILFGWLKFRRLANLHLYLTKAAGVIAYAFVIYTFVAGYNEIFFYVTAALLIVSSLECLVLQLFAPRVDEHMKSIYHAYRAASRR